VGTENRLLRKPGLAFLSTRAGAWANRKLVPIDRWLLKRSAGRYTVFGPFATPLMLLTTTGRRSGEPKTIPLVYYREGSQIFVVGSNYGQANHPAWSGNLLADPSATVATGGKAIPVTATLLAEPERTRIFQAFKDMFSTYHGYEHRTTRSLRVFALTAA